MLKRNKIIIFARNPLNTLTDEAYIKSCESFVQLKHEMKKYMTYYNHSCYQWNLKKMTPVCIQKSPFLECPIQGDQLYLLPLKSLKPIYKSIKVDIISLWNLY
ncbi:hypothetical protein A6286_15510 [Bacillus wiedmannii]|nr:hypothetical protein A6286_15510 [Bacillus wiedmannii]